ncbi:hypothetical protein HMPREF0591_1416 [Mycobacterium parascrofulaceum ATCC BAA-614]|uniref:Uncharacterized protein n=2 Tax=Mycobacterium parascrofulaceum TaxID=240125 RepID=D5P5H2_9MYCO|nr:hypothetical protein HMPREF0591_1416 [Mycobacterium parascrofulaceum ATCC BAA-614]
MAAMADGTLSTQDWMLEQLLDDRPAPSVTAQPAPSTDVPDSHDDADTDAEADDDHHPSADGIPVEAAATPQANSRTRSGMPYDLDQAADAAAPTDADVNRGAKRTAIWLGCGATAVAVLIVAAFVSFGGGPAPVQPPQHHATAPAAVVTGAPMPSRTVPQQDQAVPFTPSSDSCTPDDASGEQPAARSPLALTDTTTDSAWVCGRGPQESRLDGQVLHVQFICDPSRPKSACSYMLNALSITPGWVAKTQGGKDDWLQHRVVTRVQFNFFNGNQLVDDPLPVDTHSVHGPVSVTLPRRILVSRVDVIILHTERPPANPLPSSPAPTPGSTGTEQPPTGLVDSVLGPAGPQPASPPPADPAGGASGSDPVDATFAISQLQFFGHAPN